MSLAKEHRGSKKSIRGTISLEKQGWLHFKTKKDAPSFFTELSKAVQPMWKYGVGLQTLKGARMTCKDKSGELLGRYRSKNLWPTDT